jgi:hypothetical protein
MIVSKVNRAKLTASKLSGNYICDENCHCAKHSPKVLLAGNVNKNAASCFVGV